MLALEPWPEWDPALVAESTVTMIVQVNGKVRDRLEVAADITPAEAEELALASAKVKAHVGDRRLEKVVSRPPEVVNLVVG
jgi:leucyl-tRNA synthetase